MLDRLRDARRRRVWDRDLVAGRRGEDLAHRYLRREGFIIIARNYRLSSGEAEADLIACEGEDLVIVEVKTRETAEYGGPERAVNPEKQRHLIRVGREYARKTDTPWERVRFDVVTVVMGEPPTIALLRGAFRT
ncbi:MAG: YraN family protein [Acidobacteriia bacterium]|nr:YraN family protein [Terriglobia bacterium]